MSAVAIVIPAVTAVTFALFSSASKCGSVSCILAHADISVRILTVLGWVLSVCLEIILNHTDDWRRFAPLVPLPLFAATVFTAIPDALPDVIGDELVCKGSMCVIHDIVTMIWVPIEVMALIIRRPSAPASSYIVTIIVCIFLIILNALRLSSAKYYDESSLTSKWFGCLEYLSLLCIRLNASDSIANQRRYMNL